MINYDRFKTQPRLLASLVVVILLFIFTSVMVKVVDICVVLYVQEVVTPPKILI